MAQCPQAGYPSPFELMAEIDFMGVLHKSTQRDYLARVNDPEFPKAKAAELATC